MGVAFASIILLRSALISLLPVNTWVSVALTTLAAEMIAAVVVEAVVMIVAGMTEIVTTTDMIVETTGTVIIETRDVRLPLVATRLAEGAIHVVLAQVQLVSKAIIARKLLVGDVRPGKPGPSRCGCKKRKGKDCSKGHDVALSVFKLKFYDMVFQMFLSTSKRRRFSAKKS
jgi:hypothetical protein